MKAILTNRENQRAALAGARSVSYSQRMEESTRDHGAQPLDALLELWKLDNHELVDASTEQLTHKQVQRARKGRQLTLAMMQKVTRAFNVAIWNRLNTEQREVYFEYMHKHLFNYAKGYDAAWQDPNVANGLA